MTLVYAVGDNQQRFEAGEIWAKHAEMLLRRLGGHDRLWGWLYNNRGAMRAKQGRLAEALEDQHRAVAAKEKAGGPESADIALSLANIALNLEQMGQPIEAARYAERSLRMVEVGLGPQHPRTAILLSNYAEILNKLGRHSEAREMANRALAALEGEVDEAGLFISFPLMALATAHLDDGRPAEALPILERVVAIREAIAPGAALDGEAHFGLARAIAGSGGDHGRARALAERARAEYQQAMQLPVTLRVLAQIEAWLAAN